MIARRVLLSSSYAVNSGPDNGSIEGSPRRPHRQASQDQGSDFDRLVRWRRLGLQDRAHSSIWDGQIPMPELP